MRSYLIKEAITDCSFEDIRKNSSPYILILTEDEWRTNREQLDLGIDIEPEYDDFFVTEANINFDSITGTFCIPDRSFPDKDVKFSFALDEKGMIFIDKSNGAADIVERIKGSRRRNIPSLERFIYDFLNSIIAGDIRLLEGYEKEMRSWETDIINDLETVTSEQLSKRRNDIQTLMEHYEQLEDMAQVFEENENGFFEEENLRYFRMFMNRMIRLHEKSSGLQNYTVVIRDLYITHLDIKQNRTMAILTVITTIFFPLTLITGWYGMNFVNMPELSSEYGYPVIIAVSAGIVISSIIYFKKKKWF